MATGLLDAIRAASALPPRPPPKDSPERKAWRQAIRARESACDVVLQTVALLLRGPVAPPLGKKFLVPRELREDVMQQVALRLIASGLPSTVGTEEQATAYVRRIIATKALDELGRQAPEPPPPPVTTEPLEMAPLPAPTLGGQAEVTDWILKSLQPIAENVEKTLPERDQAHFRDGWRQMLTLLEGLTTVWEIVEKDESVPPSAPKEERKRGRDRVLQNHRRIRNKMNDWIAGLPPDEEGAPGPSPAELARAMKAFVRCQRKKGPNVRSGQNGGRSS